MNATTLTTAHVINTPKGKMPVSKAVTRIEVLPFDNEEQAAAFADLALRLGNKFLSQEAIQSLYFYARQNEIDAAYADGDITYAMWYGRTWRLRRSMLKDASLPRTYLNEKRKLQSA